MARRWPEHSRRVSRSTTLRVIRLLSRELRQQVLRLPPSLVLQEQRAPQVQRALAEPRVALVVAPVEVVVLVVLADKVGAALTRAAVRI